MHTAPKNKVRAIFHWSQLFMKSEQHECGISSQRGIEPTFLDLSFLPVKQQQPATFENDEKQQLFAKQASFKNFSTAAEKLVKSPIDSRSDRHSTTAITGWRSKTLQNKGQNISTHVNIPAISAPYQRKGVVVFVWSDFSTNYNFSTNSDTHLPNRLHPAIWWQLYYFLHLNLIHSLESLVCNGNLEPKW